MNTRLWLGIALLLIARNCAAQTIIQDGDYESELIVLESSLLMTGGQVDRAILWGNGPYEIEGGTLGRTDLESGDLYVRGGNIDDIARTQRGGGSATAITFEGHYFRVRDRGLREYNTYVVEGWLADGSFMSIDLVNTFEYPTRNLPVNFNIVPSSPPEGDVTQDWRIDLEDLNLIRNQFGEPGYDLDTLNRARNNFGHGEFTLTENYYEVTSNPVPEPEWGILTFAIGLAAVAYIFLKGSE